MAKLEIYGASDDLIEVEGDIREEFNPSGDDPSYLGFSDGTILKITYDNDGMWRIVPMVKGTAELQIIQATDADEDYTDHAHLTGDISWVLYGSAMAKV
jgi:hypothetical protein